VCLRDGSEKVHGQFRSVYVEVHEVHNILFALTRKSAGSSGVLLRQFKCAYFKKFKYIPRAVQYSIFARRKYIVLISTF
jgi:hypothetical protein